MARSPADRDVGALLWTTPAGPSLTATERALVSRWGVGGAVLFRQNLVDLAQTRRLCADLVEASGGRAVFVATDQEGGRVTRLPAPATNFPSAMALGATGDPSLAEAAATATGRELRAFGITVDLAPVVDVNENPLNPSIGTRSFGISTERVAELAAAQVRGYLTGGVLPVAKHFPGKGGTQIDPHLDLPVVRDSAEVLRRRDLPPFKAAVEAGLPGVMIGHTAFTALDGSGTVPSTLASSVYALLRSPEVGFGGLALTDALRMQAVADRFGIPEAAVLALQAGADVVLPLAHEAEVLERIRTALAAGDVPESRVAAALSRSDEALRLLASLSGTEPERVPWDEHASLALEIARRATTLVRDDRGWLPLNPGRPIVMVEFAVDAVSQVEEAGPHDMGSAFAEALRRQGSERLDVVVVPAQTVSAEVKERVISAVTRAPRDAQVVIATREALLFPDQAGLVLEIVDRVRAGRPAVVVALRSISDMDALTEVPAFVAAYGDVPASLQAAAEVLFGRIAPRGTSPMHI